MKKVLVITDLFYNSLRTSSRIEGLCKYLTEFDWEATILTPTSREVSKEQIKIVYKNLRIIDVPCKDIAYFWKKIVGLNKNESALAKMGQKVPSIKKTFIESIIYHLLILGGTFLAYPDEIRSWRIPAIKAGRKIIENENFDAILSSSFPVTSHRVAKVLSKNAGVPWIADLRDLWTQNHNYLYPFRKKIETHLEKKTLSAASILSTVSESLAEKLKSRYKKKILSVIQNGFDPEYVNNKNLVPLTKNFTITYTGLTYQGKQDPVKLFKALQELITEKLIDGSRINIRMFGVRQPWILQLAKQFNVEYLVEQFGPQSREEVIFKQRESQVLLMYGWEDSYETGVLPIKMFEYFAARRPILAIGGTTNEQFRSILDKTRSGCYGISIPEIKKIIYKYYLEYLTYGSVIYHGLQNEMDKYNHREMSRKFSKILNEAISIK